MAKPDRPEKQQIANPHEQPEESITLRADGEERFRAAVRAAAKSGPMHRPAKDVKR